MPAVLVGCAVLALAHAAAAQAPREEVSVRVEPLFGEGTLTHGAYVPVLVVLENATGRELGGGELELWVQSYDGVLERHAARVDLPRGATRQAVITPFVDPRASHLSARYLAGGETLGRAQTGVSYAGGARSVVVLGDPPRLRGALLELDVTDQTLAGPRGARAPIGVVRFDAAGDPMLPLDAAGWASVRVLVASAPVLARASDPQRRAIADWLRAGGRLLVLPRTDADLSHPFLRELAGPVTVEPFAGELPLVPRGVESFALGCSERQRSESFGCSASVGFGRVFLVGYDGASPAAIETGVPRELVRSVYEAREPTEPALPFGRGGDRLDPPSYYDPVPSFGALRVALDPNESFRPALVFVALVLLVYVIIVGPLNFRFVQAKNRPALALVTTPLAALGCLGLLLAAGYVGKGVSMRYRRFELVDAVEGESRAPARRYTGLFATRPGSFSLAGAAAPGDAVHRISAGGDRGPVHRHEGERARLEDFRAGLWETVFLREDRLVELGGAIRFEREGRRLAAVVNETPRALEDAFVVDDHGEIYVVGDLAPGARAAIPRRSRGAIAIGYDYPSADAAGRALAAAVGLDEARIPYAGGLITLAPLATGVPALYARATTEPAPLGPFAPEHDERWLRVAPRVEGGPVAPAPPPDPPVDAASYPASLPEEEEGPPEAAPDGGAPPAGPEAAP